MHRILRDGAWVLTGQALAAMGTLAGIRLVTEVASPETYGTAILATGVVALAQGLAATPLMQAILRFYPDYAKLGSTPALKGIAVRTLGKSTALLASIVLIVLGVWGARVGNAPEIGALAAILLAVEVARAVEINFLNAARRQGAMAFLVASDAWLRPLCAVGAVGILGASAAVIVGGYAIGSLLALAGMRVADGHAGDGTLSGMPRGDLPDRRSGQELWTYARPLVPLALIAWITGQMDRYLIAGFEGIHAAGIYAAIYGLVGRPFLMSASAVELTVRQVYYQAVADRNSDEAAKILARWLGTVAVIAAALLAMFWLAHRQIAELLLAQGYRDHSHLMVWIAIGYFFAALSLVVERVCYALNDTKGVLLIQASGAAASVAIGLPLVVYFGVSGAAWAVSLYFAVQIAIAAARAATVWRKHLAAHLCKGSKVA